MKSYAMKFLIENIKLKDLGKRTDQELVEELKNAFWGLLQLEHEAELFRKGRSDEVKVKQEFDKLLNENKIFKPTV